MKATRQQRLLLRAALLPADAGVAAWHEWRHDADLDEIDRGSARLLPLLWFNLLANGVSDPWMPRFKGIYRHTWFANQVWMRRVREVQAELVAAGAQPVFLKGIALANGYYPNPGLRPMDDLDVLISPDCVSAALAALTAAGWQCSVQRPELVLRTVHAVELLSAQGTNLDVHAHLLQGSLNSDLDARRSARARRLELADGPLSVLDATDQLLHVLVHGVESDPPAPRWLADAVVVMRSAPDIEWSRLLSYAHSESRSLAVTRALDELVDVFGRENLPIPDAVLDCHAQRPRPTRQARFEQRIASGPRVPVVGYALQRAVDYQRWRRSPGDAAQRRVGFDGYLRLNWGVESRREVIMQAMRRGSRTARADLRSTTTRLRRGQAADGVLAGR